MTSSLTDGGGGGGGGKSFGATDFNAIFKNDELAKEISQLIEKANGIKSLKSKTDDRIRYSRDELMEIKKLPTAKLPKSAFYALLEDANLSDNIINSLVKKTVEERYLQQQNDRNFAEREGGDLFDDLGGQSSYNPPPPPSGRVFKSNNNGPGNIGGSGGGNNQRNPNNPKARGGNNSDGLESGGYRENPMNSRYEKNTYRSANHSDAVQSWRTDKNSASGAGSSNANNNGGGKREYNTDSRYNNNRSSGGNPYGNSGSGNRFYNNSGARNKYNDYNNREYGGSGHYHNHHHDNYAEEEPEWFSNGPESMNDFIDLKGFDDDEKCQTSMMDNSGDRRRSEDLGGADGSSNNSSRRNTRKSSVDGGDEYSGRSSAELFEEVLGKSSSTPANVADITFSRDLSADLSAMLSGNASFLESKDFPLPFSFGNTGGPNTSGLMNASSSRAEKWFKKDLKRESVSGNTEAGNTSSKTISPLGDKSTTSSTSSSVMDLLARKLMTPSASLQTSAIKVDMSKATSLADLEASMLSGGDSSNKKPQQQMNGPPSSSASDNSAAMSKLLMSLASGGGGAGGQNAEGPLSAFNNANMRNLFASGAVHQQQQQHPPQANSPVGGRLKLTLPNTSNNAAAAPSFQPPPLSPRDGSFVTQVPFLQMERFFQQNPNFIKPLFGPHAGGEAVATAPSGGGPVPFGPMHPPPLESAASAPGMHHPTLLRHPFLAHPPAGGQPLPLELAMQLAGAAGMPVPPPGAPGGPFHHPHPMHPSHPGMQPGIARPPFVPPPNMMGGPPHGPHPPHPLAAQMLAQMMMAQQQQQVLHHQQQAQALQQQQPSQQNSGGEVSESAADSVTLAEKLLKNSKFTPTSVFRKLKSDSKSAASTTSFSSSATPPTTSAGPSKSPQPKAAQDNQQVKGGGSGGNQTLLDMLKSEKQQASSTASSSTFSNTIPHPLSNIQPTSSSSANDKGTNDMTQLLHQLSMNSSRQPLQQAQHTKISDILFAMSSAKSGNAGGPEGGEGRSNPLMNAVKLEDLEKF